MTFPSSGATCKIQLEILSESERENSIDSEKKSIILISRQLEH